MIIQMFILSAILIFIGIAGIYQFRNIDIGDSIEFRWVKVTNFSKRRIYKTIHIDILYLIILGLGIVLLSESIFKSLWK